MIDAHVCDLVKVALNEWGAGISFSGFEAMPSPATGIRLAQMVRQASDHARQTASPHSMKEAVVKVTGMGPSLHRCKMLFCIYVDASHPTDTQVACVLSQMKPHLLMQKARFEARRRLGLPGLRSITMPADIEINHLHADASDLAIRISRFTKNHPAILALHDYRNAIKRINSWSSGRRRLQDVAHGDEDAIVYETQDGRRVVETVLHPLIPGRADVSLHPGSNHGHLPNGLVLWHRALPESVVSQAPGRRLGDFVTAHPLLDRRIVERIDIDSHSTNIVLRSALFPIARIADMSADDAHALLQRHLANDDWIEKASHSRG